MKDILKALLIFLTVLIFTILWVKLINFLFMKPHFTEAPMLRERFGTIMWHSDDKNGIYLGSLNDPSAVDHIYCYYPKASANSKLLIKRVDSGDCSNWYGKIVFREAAGVSEREKYNWN